jgi:hypothetical protein
VVLRTQPHGDPMAKRKLPLDNSYTVRLRYNGVYHMVYVRYKCDLPKILEEMALRALRRKSKRASTLFGMIQVKVMGQPTDPPAQPVSHRQSAQAQ